MTVRRMGTGWLVGGALLLAALATGLTTTRASDATDATIYDCDRQCLKQISDLYFDALAKHDPSLLPLSPDVKYTETGVVTKLGEGIWKNAGEAGYRLELFDPHTGGVGANAVVPVGGVPTIIALRLKVKNHLITEVESIVIRKDETAVMSAPEKLTKPSNFFTRKIRPAEQNSRYELMAAADGYFRAFETEGTPDYIRAPLLPDTLRFENGMQTTNAAMKTATMDFPATTAAEQFDMGAFKGAKVTDRRYAVVDTEIGAVTSWVRFGDPNGPAPPASANGPAGANANYGAPFVSETFAVTQGKIVEIQAIWIPSKGRLQSPF
jgi:hypothetical protein